MRHKFRRLAAVALLGLTLAPGLWWRTGLVGEAAGDLRFEALPIEAARSPAGAPILVGAWRLVSDDWRCFGYSALVVHRDGRFRAYSDNNSWIEFAPPNRASGPVPRFGTVPGKDSGGPNDLEAAVHDSASGITWLAFEKLNSIRRIGPGDDRAVSVAPPAMAGFRPNGGAEVMARLADGRFVVIAESGDWRYPLRRTGLLFARDPVADPRAAPFAFHPPPGYDPTDAATLPDGRVLILLRGLAPGRWPPFRSKLVIADPADLRTGESWPWQEVADLAGLAPRENYEGLTVEREGSGVALWLIADANSSVLLQRTLLVKLLWKEWRRP